MYLCIRTMSTLWEHKPCSKKVKARYANAKA